MERWESLAERQIREAIEAGAFDNLAGKGRPLDLTVLPFETPLASTIRRIFRDNGVTHPLMDARQAIESELEAARADFRRTSVDADFQSRLKALNREIRLFNLKSPIPNFHLPIIDIDLEVASLRRG